MPVAIQITIDYLFLILGFLYLGSSIYVLTKGLLIQSALLGAGAYFVFWVYLLPWS